MTALDEAEVLTLILSRSAGTRAASLSIALLERFGCLARVCSATLAELRPVAGRSAALELRLLADLMRRVLEFEVRKRPLLTSWSAVRAYLRATLAGRSRAIRAILEGPSPPWLTASPADTYVFPHRSMVIPHFVDLTPQ